MAMFILELMINVCMFHIMDKNCLVNLATCPVQSKYRKKKGMMLFTEDYFIFD